MAEEGGNRLKLGCAVLALFFLLLCVPVAYLILRDSPEIDDSDLDVKYEAVADGDNGFFILEDAFNALELSQDSPVDEYASDRRWDEKDVAAIVKANEVAFQFWIQAYEQPRIQAPECKSMNSDVGYLSHWRQLARIASLRSRFLGSQGKHEEAMEVALQIVRLGRKLEESDGAFINYWVCIGVEAIGLSRIEALAAEYELPKPLLLNTEAELSRLEPDPAALIKSMKVEYKTAIVTIDDVAAGDPSATGLLRSDLAGKARVPGLYKKNETRRMFAEAFRALIRSIESIRDGKGYSPLDIEEKMHVRPDLPKAVLSGNIIGEHLYMMLVPIFSKVPQRCCRAQMEVRRVRLLLVLKAYHGGHNRLPESLDALVPAYIKLIPADPFEPKNAIGYSRKEGILYSFGPDRKDDGGMTRVKLNSNRYRAYGQHRIWDQPDPSFLIEFKGLPADKYPRRAEPGAE